MRVVPITMKMDDEKVKKQHAKRLARQNIPSRPENRKMPLFSHLSQFDRSYSISTCRNFDDSNIHPAIIKLGVQYAEGVIKGSNARCISMLLALKELITDFRPKENTDFSRDLDFTLKPSIGFLSQCRPLSVGMGSAIKYLKYQISQLSNQLSTSECKKILINDLESFLNDRILLAAKSISNHVLPKIQDSDVILTYGGSSIVLRVLKDAYNAGKTFSVIVVDSRPHYEGIQMVKKISKTGIKCTYCIISSLSYVIKKTTKVIIGAHSVLVNGYVMSRVGTAVVASMARYHHIPILVCCETYKLSERAQTDSIVFNELGDVEDLVRINTPYGKLFENWKNMSQLTLLNVMYDVTPPQNVTAVVTEMGLVPCTSAPVLLRIKNMLK